MQKLEFIRNLTDYWSQILAAIAVLIPTILKILKEVNKYRKGRLTNHVIFSHLNELVSCVLPVWVGDNSLKSQLIRKCVRIYAINMCEWLHDLILRRSWDVEEVSVSLSTMFQKTEQCWREAEIPGIFIRKYKAANLRNVQYLHKQIHRANDSEVYDSLRAKKLLILSTTEFFFFSELKDLDNLVLNLNGELEAALDEGN